MSDADVNAFEQDRLQLLRDVHKNAMHAYHLQHLDTDERLRYKSTVLYKAAKHGESIHELRL